MFALSSPCCTGIIRVQNQNLKSLRLKKKKVNITLMNGTLVMGYSTCREIHEPKLDCVTDIGQLMLK